MSPTRRGPLRPLSVAPMMQVTDRHHRALMRTMTRRTLLYTEMVTTGALLRGEPLRHLACDEVEHPVAIQLGGDDPVALAACAEMADDAGFDEVDLNVGCPSPRVARGSFGACLMRDPDRVADAVATMRAAVTVPVTVKHRVGVDELDDYEHLATFVERVAAAGCDRFIVHARKALLSGLSPKENRTVPPLRYDLVHRLKADFGGLAVEINGGFADLDAAEAQLALVDGVMIGRAAADDPFVFADADRRIFGADNPLESRRQVVEAMLPYVESQTAAGVPLHRITRHMLNLFAGQRGARAWRRALSEGCQRPGAGIGMIRDALEARRDF